MFPWVNYKFANTSTYLRIKINRVVATFLIYDHERTPEGSATTPTNSTSNMIYSDLTQLIGNTPLLDARKLATALHLNADCCSILDAVYSGAKYASAAILLLYIRGPRFRGIWILWFVLFAEAVVCPIVPCHRPGPYYNNDRELSHRTPLGSFHAQRLHSWWAW